jgi:hypothetical protein
VTKGLNISEVIIAVWLIALAVPLCALILIVALMRLPTKILLITGVRFLLYYYSVTLIVTLLLTGVLVVFDLSDPISPRGTGLWGALIIVVGVNFARVTRLLFTRPYWAGLVALILSQNVLPVLAVSVFAEHPHRWSFETKYDKARVAGIIKVFKFEEETPHKSYGKYTIDGIICPEWKIIFKGKAQLEAMKPERRWISVVTPMRGRELEIKQNSYYFVFLDIYEKTLIPLRGSPTSFYEVGGDENRTMIPLGHLSFVTEKKVVNDESIPLREMLLKIEPQLDYEKFIKEIPVTCNQATNE